MALTKTTEEIDGWAKIAQADVREGVNFDVSDAYEATLHVDVALGSTTAHTGTEVIVQTRTGGTDPSRNDANWSTLTRFIGPTGTSLEVALLNAEAAGQEVLGVNNPTTVNMDNDKKFKFIGAVIEENSEIIYQQSNSGDGGDTITIQDGLTNQQETTSNIYDIDDAQDEAVGMYQIAVPSPAIEVRVLYNNNYDPDGSAVYSRTRISKVTGV